MVQTSIRPTSKEISIQVPEIFIGKEVKIILFVEQEEDQQIIPRKMSDFKGILTKDEGAQLQEYVKHSREEWERDI